MKEKPKHSLEILVGFIDTNTVVMIALRYRNAVRRIRMARKFTRDFEDFLFLWFRTAILLKILICKNLLVQWKPSPENADWN